VPPLERTVNSVLTALTVVLALQSGGAGVGQPAGRGGFSGASVPRQQDAERRFQDSVNAESISRLHRTLTLRPHPAGTAAGEEMAELLRLTLSGYGFEVERLQYDAWLSQARRIRVNLLTPVARELSVREPALDADPDTRHVELGDAFIAYAASGDVTAPVVYVNYGLPDDYARLQALGVTVKGRIVLARYARSHRAVKVHTAEQAGAAGVLLYSDPADDGAARGAVWPPGYWRGDGTPQRGNAKYSWFWHGDPLTPGEPALAGVSRRDARSAPTLPRLPVAVLASSEARHVLEALGGPEAPESFRGGIPLPYRTGPGDSRVRLHVDMDDGLRPIHNVVARLRGSTWPDRMVMLGGHHDAWTFGGVDPGTGAAALLEVARGLGQLAASGWRPMRTIAIAFWDAEEYGLIGSTEYAEHQRQLLQEQLIAYVNTDMYMTGRFDPGGVPSLRDLVADVARDVSEGPAASPGTSVYDRWRDDEWRRQAAGRQGPPPASFEVDLKTLGSGADFVPFQDHLGVPTLSVEFIGANGYGFGAYHSNYDTRAYAERVADPGFAQGPVLARLLGTLAMRLSGADVLPFRFSHYAARIQKDLDAVDRRLPAAQRAAAGGLSTLAARIRETAAALERDIDQGLAAGRMPDPRTPALNDRLARVEQRLTDDEGPAASRWYRHVIHGWNIYSLYDGQPFPGLEEAIRLKDGPRVSHEVGRIERALRRMLSELEIARTLAAAAP
jgi:N-acetylated-alpha-linked acidic dipeptidase